MLKLLRQLGCRDLLSQTVQNPNQDLHELNRRTETTQDIIFAQITYLRKSFHQQRNAITIIVSTGYKVIKFLRNSPPMLYPLQETNLLSPYEVRYFLIQHPARSTLLLHKLITIIIRLDELPTSFQLSDLAPSMCKCIMTTL